MVKEPCSTHGKLDTWYFSQPFAKSAGTINWKVSIRVVSPFAGSILEIPSRMEDNQQVFMSMLVGAVA